MSSSLNGHHIVQSLEKIGAPIILLDAIGLVAWVNAAARGLFADEDGAIVGQSLARLLSPPGREEVRETVRRIVLGELESASVTVRVAGADGAQVEADLSMAPVLLDGYVAGVAVVGTSPVRSRRRRRRLV